MAFRNRYILEHSEKVVFAAIDPNGALSRLIGEYPDLQWQVLARGQKGQVDRVVLIEVRQAKLGMDY